MPSVFFVLVVLEAYSFTRPSSPNRGIHPQHSRSFSVYQTLKFGTHTPRVTAKLSIGVFSFFSPVTVGSRVGPGGISHALLAPLNREELVI